MFKIGYGGQDRSGNHAGIRALRRTVQRHVAPPLYRAYVAGQLSEEALERLAVHVRLVAGEVQVGLRERVG